MHKKQSAQGAQNNRITVIRPKKGLSLPSLKELAEYKDLILLFAGRDLSVKYRQTVLGPLWLVIMPVISALVSTFVFGGIARIDSSGLPYFVFYFAAFTLWSYFSTSLTSTATTFTSNALLFRRVYFPRLAVPAAHILSNLFRFAVQFALLVIVLLIFWATGTDISPVWGMVWLLPLLVVQSALLALGVGALLSALTAKYRDLASLVSVGVDLWKYLTPVVYSASTLTGGVRIFCLVNPMGAPIEAFRYILLGAGGAVFPEYLLISLAETLVILFLGALVFHRVERNFVDTV